MLKGQTEVCPLFRVKTPGPLCGLTNPHNFRKPPAPKSRRGKKLEETRALHTRLHGNHQTFSLRRKPRHGMASWFSANNSHTSTLNPPCCLKKKKADKSTLRLGSSTLNELFS